jgi:hypothetical protein
MLRSPFFGNFGCLAANAAALALKATCMAPALAPASHCNKQTTQQHHRHELF